MQNRVEFHPSIGKILLLISGCTGFAIAGGMLSVQTDVVGAVIGILTVLAFGTFAALGVWRLSLIHI